jgi:hypothetical protein
MVSPSLSEGYIISCCFLPSIAPLFPAISNLELHRSKKHQYNKYV